MTLELLQTVADPMFQSNSYIIFDPESRQGVVVDPGHPDTFDHLLREHGITLTKIVNTHGHLDHVSGVAATCQLYEIPFLIHAEDAFLVRSVNTYTANYGLPEMEVPEIDGHLEHGQQISVGESSIEILHTPGHSPGSVCIKFDSRVITGDLIFMQGIGRHDLPRGDYAVLMDSIEREILSLPDETELFPGHGPKTTVGSERRGNPFLQ